MNHALAIANATFDTDFRITVQPTFLEDTVDMAAIRYIETNKIGEEKNDSAFILYISKNPRKFSLMTRDRAQDIFYAGVREEIFEKMLPDMKADRYEEAAQTFLDYLTFYSVRNRLRKAFANEERDDSRYLFEDVRRPASGSESRGLNQRLHSLSNRYKMDVIVYVSDKKGKIDPYDEVFNLAIRNRLGDDRKHDAVIFYINTAQDINVIVPRGKGGVIFGDYAKEKLEPMLDFFIKPNRYLLKGNKFAGYAEKFLEMDKKGTPYNENHRFVSWSLLIFTAVFMGLIVSAIGFLLIVIKSFVLLKRASKVKGISAVSYLGFPHFVVRADNFIKSTTYTVYDKDNASGFSGGSSSSSSGGGSSYGGTSGDY